MFTEDPSAISRFYVMLPTDRQTDRQTDESRVTHNNLLNGGGNVCAIAIYVTRDELYRLTM